MQASTTCPGPLLEQLLDCMSDFPDSSPESPLAYNYVKLMHILQRKEALAFADAATVEEAIGLTVQYGRMSGLINQGKPEEALALVQQLDEVVEEKLSHEIYLYAKQWGLSVKALYYYRKKLYGRAFSLTLECIALNEYLVKIAGFGTLLYRCLDQHANLSRLHFSQGQREKGARLYGSILNYLLNGEATDLPGTLYTDQRCWEAIPYVREASVLEHFKSTVNNLIKCNVYKKNQEKELFFLLFDPVKEFEISTPERRLIYNWLYLKKIFYNQDYELFLHEFTGFMQEPMSRSFDIFKLSLLQNVLYLLEGSGIKNKASGAQAVAEFVNGKLNVNDNLKLLVCGGTDGAPR